MRKFIQDSEHDVHMYAKFEGFTFFIVIIKNSKIWFIWIFYTATRHKNAFGRAYCKDLLKAS
jgi:hypothetical protein